MNREKAIRQITDELKTLSEPDLKAVQEQVRALRKKSTDKDFPPQPPFIDEIERVEEQTRGLPGARDNPQFT